jgi:AraC-like DNA-binding protein
MQPEGAARLVVDRMNSYRFLQFYREDMITAEVRDIAPGLAGELRRTVAGARHHIDHRHANLEFDLVVKGTGSLTIGERNYELKPGIMIWLVPGQQHQLVRSPGLEMWVANLRPELIELQRIARLAERPLRQLPAHELIDLDRLLSQVAQDSDDPVVYNAGIAYVAMRAWRASLDSPAARVRPLHPAVGRALLLLRESGAALSLSELADAAGVAAPYLSRLLIEHTGRSFVDWRNRIRIDRFMQGYTSGANLLDAALAAGFGSYARFNHVFNEMIGCAPSEWVKEAERNGSAAELPDSYGLPTAPTLSMRQSWTSVLPLVAPNVGSLLGGDFIDRLLAAPGDSDEPTLERFEPLDPNLTSSACDRLVATLRQRDPERADTLARLIDLHDFADTYARLCEAFGLSSGRLVVAIAALAVALSVAANPSSEPTPAEVQAATRQAQAVLGRALTRLGQRAAQDVHTAFVCSVVVAYRAVEAARASGDPRSFDQLREAASHCAREAFGGDVTQVVLGRHGFVRRQTSGKNRRAGTKHQHDP